MHEWYEYIGEREERELRLFRRFLKCKTGCMVYAISIRKAKKGDINYGII